MILLPVLALVSLSLSGALTEGVVDGAVALPVWNTLLLGFFTVVLAVCWGVAAAWLVEMCLFPLRKLFAVLLFLPFAVPIYLQAYIWADLIDDGGWLPIGYGIRNLGGAGVVMSFVLYPYVYIFTRAAFAQQSGYLLSASRMLGCTPYDAFRRVALPVARPAIAVGALLVFMETVNDIAIAEDFGLGTLGYYIYDVWLNRDNRAAAAAAALPLVALACVLVFLELFSRRRQRQYQLSARRFSLDTSYRLQGAKLAGAVAFCLFLSTAGFIVPLAYLLFNLPRDLVEAMIEAMPAAADSVLIAVFVALLGFLLGGLLSYFKRHSRSRGFAVFGNLPLTGYAFPGVIYGMGAIVGMSALANALEGIAGVSIHWIWTSTAALLVFALSCRFIAIACGAVDAGLAVIPPHLDAAGRNAGKNRFEMLLRVYLPLMRPAVLAGLLLLTVDVIKELPLTLIIRPLGVDTLALQIFQYAADEDLVGATPAALLLLLLASVFLGFAYIWIVPEWRNASNRASGKPV